MFVGITNTPRDYAWGSTSAIAGLLGTEPSGGPEAELWLGAHPGSPARILEPDVAGAGTLAELLGGERLPFLLKVLAAASPLSLQAHPTMAQAEAGFAKENALGIPLGAAERNYKDAFHKPELIFALSETFDALCGFRPVAATRALLAELGPAAAPLLDRLTGDDALPGVFEWLISRGEGVDALIPAVVGAASALPGEAAFANVARLAEAYPGDPGVLISLLLNSVTLKRGEALYLPAGNIHAYLDGLGIELMAASDNVLRGGLTPKYVDVPELLSVLDFTPLPVPFLPPIELAPGVTLYRPDVTDFELVHVTGDAEVALHAPAIALCTAGAFELAGESGGPGASRATALVRAGAVYITPDESPLRITGTGELFLATARP